MDPTGLNIPEAKVKIIEDKTKSEIEAIFESIEAEEGVHLGVFVICVGFYIYHEYHKRLYADVNAELDERFVADFNFCSDGGLICFNMLTSKLTNNTNISCLLMQVIDFQMYSKCRHEIKTEHLVKNSEGKVEFPKSDLNHITGHSRHLYYP